MALTYPDYTTPQPSQTRLIDLLDLWDQGVAQGKANRYEREAPQQFAQAAAPLSEFGLTTPPDQLRALFANPETRPFAVQMVQEATARRAAANNALLPKRVAQSRYIPARVPRPAASTPLSVPAPQSMATSTDQAPATKGVTDYETPPAGATPRGGGSVRPQWLEAMPDDPLAMIMRQKAENVAAKAEAAAASKQWAVDHLATDPLTGSDYSLPWPGNPNLDFTPVKPNYSFGTSYGSTLNPLPMISAFGNELAASTPIAGPYLKRTGEEVDAAFANWWNGAFNSGDVGTGKNGSATVEDIARRNADMARHNPTAAAAGKVAGEVLPYALASEVPVLNQAIGAYGPMLQRAIMTFLSQQAINTGNNLAKGQPVIDATGNAVMPSLLAVPNALLGREAGDNMTPDRAALIDILSTLVGQ